jgi:hypothetical protein
MEEFKDIEEAIKSLNINEEYKKNLFEYIIEFRKSNSNILNDFTFTFPYIYNDNFYLNKAIKFIRNDQLKSGWLVSDEQSQWLNFLPKHRDLLPYLGSNETKEINEVIELIRKINFKLDEIENDNKKIKDELRSLKDVNNQLKSTFYDSILTSNIDEKIQFIPVDIYLDTNNSNEIFKVYTSIIDFLRSIDFEIAFEFDAIKGSWIKKIIAKSQKVMTSDELVDRLKEAEYGIEVNAILKQQSEIDKNQSEALLNILKSVENVPNAAIRIGSLLVVKITPNDGEVNVQVRSLSIKELHLLNKKPQLLHKPQEILTALTKEINQDNTDSLN